MGEYRSEFVLLPLEDQPFAVFDSCFTLDAIVRRGRVGESHEGEIEDGRKSGESLGSNGVLLEVAPGTVVLVVSVQPLGVESRFETFHDGGAVLRVSDWSDDDAHLEMDIKFEEGFLFLAGVAAAQALRGPLDLPFVLIYQLTSKAERTLRDHS